MIFLMETKQCLPYLERKRAIFNFANGFYVNPIGRAGGLALWWINDSQIRIISHSSHLIHVEVKCDQNFQCTFLHVPSKMPIGEKIVFWMEISNLHRGSNEPWLIVGYFNSFCFPYEKEGGNSFSASSTAPFRDFISNNELMDLGF
ncbi:hypothetical protein LINGRAHAP2_LOCUS8106 [Linum grandiflorum]